MPKFLNRFVALLLVPCLMADPALASVFAQPAAPIAPSAFQKNFNQQAIVPKIEISIHQRWDLLAARLIRWFPRLEPAPSSEKSIRLKDGRMFGYQEYGEGLPVFYFPGWPGSRLERTKDIEDTAKELGVRFIAVDPPGIGLSSPRKNAKVADIASDVVELANALHIERFVLLGYSLGGPAAAATAQILGDRVINLGLISSVGPVTEPSMRGHYAPGYRMFFYLVTRYPRFTQHLLSWTLQRGLQSRWLWPILLGAVRSTVSSDDARIFKDPANAAMVRHAWTESFRQGPAALVERLRISFLDWGFSLNAIRQTTYLWHGDQDRNVPYQMAHRLAELIPDPIFTPMPGKGHVFILDLLRDLLDPLTSPHVRVLDENQTRVRTVRADPGQTLWDALEKSTLNPADLDPSVRLHRPDGTSTLMEPDQWRTVRLQRGDQLIVEPRKKTAAAAPEILLYGESRERVEAWMKIVGDRMDSAENEAQRRHLTDYARAGLVLESVTDLFRFWIGLDAALKMDEKQLPTPTDAELAELGNRIRAEWSARGHQEAAGHMNPDIALLNSREQDPAKFRESDRRIQGLLGGTPAEQLLGQWTSGVKTASHLFDLGLHLEKDETGLFDVEEVLIPTARRYIPLLLQWRAQPGEDAAAARIVTPSPTASARTPLTFDDLMLWGLLAQVNPSIYYKVYPFWSSPADGISIYVQNQGGPQALSEKILKRMLEDLNPAQTDRVEDLFADALALSAADWEARGVTPPWHAHRTSFSGMWFRPMKRDRSDPHAVYREPILEMLTTPGSGDVVEERRRLENMLYAHFPKLKSKVNDRQKQRPAPNSNIPQPPAAEEARPIFLDAIEHILTLGLPRGPYLSPDKEGSGFGAPGSSEKKVSPEIIHQAETTYRLYEKLIDEAKQFYQGYSRDHRPAQARSFNRAITQAVRQARMLQGLVETYGPGILPINETSLRRLKRAAGGAFTSESVTDFRGVEDDVLPLVLPDSIPLAVEDRVLWKSALKDQPEVLSLQTIAKHAIEVADILWSDGHPEIGSIQNLSHQFSRLYEFQLANNAGYALRVRDSWALAVAPDFSRNTLASYYAHELSELVLSMAHPAWLEAATSQAAVKSTDWISTGIFFLIWAHRNHYHSLADLQAHADPLDRELFKQQIEFFTYMFAAPSEPVDQAAARLQDGIAESEQLRAERDQAVIAAQVAQGNQVENRTPDVKPYLVGAGLAGLAWREAQRETTEDPFKRAGAFFTEVIRLGPQHALADLIQGGLMAMGSDPSSYTADSAAASSDPAKDYLGQKPVLKLILPDIIQELENLLGHDGAQDFLQQWAHFLQMEESKGFSHQDPENIRTYVGQMLEQAERVLETEKASLRLLTTGVHDLLSLIPGLLMLYPHVSNEALNKRVDSAMNMWAAQEVRAARPAAAPGDEAPPSIPETVTHVEGQETHIASSEAGDPPFPAIDYLIQIHGSLTVEDVYGDFFRRVQQMASPEGGLPLMLKREIDMGKKEIILDEAQKDRHLPLHFYDEEAALFRRYFPGYKVIAKAVWGPGAAIGMLRNYDARLVSVTRGSPGGPPVMILADSRTQRVRLETRELTLTEILEGARAIESYGQAHAEGRELEVDELYPFHILTLSLEGYVRGVSDNESQGPAAASSDPGSSSSGERSRYAGRPGHWSVERAVSARWQEMRHAMIDPWDRFAGAMNSLRRTDGASPIGPRRTSTAAVPTKTSETNGFPQTRAEVDVLLRSGERGLIQLQKALKSEKKHGLVGQPELRKYIWERLLERSFNEEPITVIPRSQIPGKGVPAYIKNLGHVVIKGHIAKGGMLQIGDLIRDDFENYSDTDYELEVLDGRPLRLFFLKDNSAVEYFTVTDNKTGQIIDVYTARIKRDAFKTYEDVTIEGELAADGTLFIGGGKYAMNGKPRDKAAPWAVFTQHASERGKITVQKGLVTGFTSHESDFNVRLVLVWKKSRKKYTTSFQNMLLPDEFNQLGPDYEIHHFPLDGTGTVNMGGRGKWLLFGSDQAGQLVRITDIQNTSERQAVIVAAVLENDETQIKKNALVYQAPSGARADSFERGPLIDIFKTHSALSKRIRESGDYVIAGAYTTSLGTVEMADYYWGIFQYYPHTEIEAKIVAGQPRFIKFVKDQKGQPIRDVYGNPLIIDVLQPVRRQLMEKSPLYQHVRLRRSREVYEEGIKLFLEEKFVEAIRKFKYVIFLSTLRKLSIEEESDLVESARMHLAWAQERLDVKAHPAPGRSRDGAASRRPHPLDAAAQRVLLQSVRAGQKVARSILAENYIDAVRKQALQQSNEHYRELLQEGVGALYGIIDDYAALQNPDISFEDFSRDKLEAVFARWRRASNGDLYKNRSLTAPGNGHDGDGHGMTLMDLLADESVGNEDALAERLDIKRALGQLSDLERDVVRSSIEDEIPIDEIAVRCGIAESEVANILQSALAKLRTTLSEVSPQNGQRTPTEGDKGHDRDLAARGPDKVGVAKEWIGVFTVIAMAVRHLFGRDIGLAFVGMSGLLLFVSMFKPHWFRKANPIPFLKAA